MLKKVNDFLVAHDALVVVVMLGLIAFGTIWMGYEQYAANHIMNGITDAAQKGHW